MPADGAADAMKRVGLVLDTGRDVDALEGETDRDYSDEFREDPRDGNIDHTPDDSARR